MVPRVNDSDGKGYNGHITGRTDKGLLRVIIQAAWVAVRYNKIYKEFFENVKSRRGKQKAIVAVAKKMIVNVYYVLKRSSPTANDLTIECVKED